MTKKQHPLKVLIAGWFSFENMGTTAGDLIARDLVCRWLQEAQIGYDVAMTPQFSFPGSLLWQEADPDRYTDVLFVCGPFGNGWPLTDFLARFSGARITGLNLSLLQSLDEWNPFTLLYERDSSAAAHPDITFYAPPPRVPVAGLILVHPQKEYGKRALHEQANTAIDRLTRRHEMSIVPIDTALEQNAGGLRTPGEVEALIARMDVVLTTRLHGTVLALKNGVPVVPIDPIAGGAKIARQVHTLEWPLLFVAGQLDDALLDNAYAYCLTEEARALARSCALRARHRVEAVRNHLVTDLLHLRQNPVAI
ncbi:polysaccharide pyruvyl transferase family protein [Paraflavisolibacter sp. H34]|uniref:polysaccharide pyruvyl transferase family protein n=1 Tax=Huijunlia imazamoxiresistens TaxID=3127457 RepID=UPI00301798CC